MAFFRRKSIAFFMATLMLLPQFSYAVTTNQGEVPDVRPGAIQNGKVDYASGNLAFIKDLFDLKGYKLTIKYNSEGIKDEVSIRNHEAPTGVVGVGWKLSKDRIVRLTHQTSNTTDDEYLLNAHGKISKLTFEYEANDTIHFRLHSNPYWRILFLEDKDQWIVQKQNGNEYIYGDGNSDNSLIDHEAESTESSIVWDNWIGSSVAKENRNKLTVAWNLSAIDNKYGERVKLFYDRVWESVGEDTSLPKYTKANYLVKVVDMDENYIELTYGEKDFHEYRDPHRENTVASEQSQYGVAAPDPYSKNDKDAFQERFETKYLSSVKRYSYVGVLDRKVELKYSLMGNDFMKKRYLTEIQYLNQDDIDYQPSTKYDYYGSDDSDGVYTGLKYDDTKLFNPDNGALYGAIKGITIPGGGTYLYTYDKIQIANSSLDFDIPFPEKEKYTDEKGDVIWVGWKAPKLFFMNDYVVVLHETNDYDLIKTNISVCTWIGDRWTYQDFGSFYGNFFDRYHLEDYHEKNLISSLKNALLTGISENIPLVGGLMNAFNDAITDDINMNYYAAIDLQKGDVKGAIKDLMKGTNTLIKDIVDDIVANLKSTFDDFDDTVSDMFGHKTHSQEQHQLAEEAEKYNAKNPRKEYHITLQKDFFALTTSFADKSSGVHDQNAYIFEKDRLVEGNWGMSAIPVFVTSKYITIDSGNDFVVVFDELTDVFFTMTRHRHRKWLADFYRINQVLTDAEKLKVSTITAQAVNGILEAFGDFSEDDQDYLNLLSSNKRSAVAANSNYIIIATSQADGSNARIQMFSHDKNRNWDWRNPATQEFDKTLIPEDAAGSMAWLADGLAANSLLQLKAGNSIAALQVYDNLNTEAYNDVASIAFGGVGTTDGSTNPLNPLSTLENDLQQDLSAMNATYGIVWNEDMSEIEVKLLHAAVGQTGIKMYLNGNVIHKIGKAYSLLIGAQKSDDNGINYAFRYDGEKFISASFESDYFSTAMAPDVASQVVESSDKAYKTPKFRQFNANRPVHGNDFTTVSTLGQVGVVLGGTDLSSYNSAEMLANVPSSDSWSLIDNASHEQINSPEFVKEAIHFATDLVNFIIQVIMMIIPFAQEFAIAEEMVSIIDKVVQVAGLALMVVQPAADALVDRVLGVNHKSTSIANNYISVNGKLFARWTNGEWEKLGQAFELNDDDKLVGTTNDISNGYYNYTVQKGSGTPKIQSHLAILKNGEIYRSLLFNQESDGELMIARRDSLTLTGGNKAFVSYGPINDDGYVKRNHDIIRPDAENAEERRRKQSYEDATLIRLHRIAEDNASGKLHDYVVKMVETNTGYESTYQHYHYDAETASHNDSHGATVYPKVTVIPKNTDEYNQYVMPFGAYRYYYFNNQNFYADGEQAKGYPKTLDFPTDDPLLTYESFDHRDTDDFNSRGIIPMNGRQYLSEIITKNGQVKSRSMNCHSLYAHDFFHRASILELDHVYQPLSSVKVKELDGVVQKTVNQYTDEYRATLLRTVEHHSKTPTGEEEIFYTTKRYAFEHYPDLLDQNRMTEVYLVVDSVRRGSYTYVTGAEASNYIEWEVNGKSILDVENTYSANLSDDILDPSIENYQVKGAENMALQDADYADLDALIAAFELEAGNYHNAIGAVIGANKAAVESYDELAVTRQELVNAQHEIQQSVLDLDESNAQLEQAQIEMQNAKDNYDELEQEFLDSKAEVKRKYNEWQKQILEKEIVVPLAFAGSWIAGIIAEKQESHKVHEKHKNWEKAVATADAKKLAAETAYDDYLSTLDVYDSLNAEHEAVVAAINLSNTELKNTIDAFKNSYNSSSDAHEAAVEALTVSAVTSLDLTDRAHRVSVTNQDTAVVGHVNYKEVADDAINALKNIIVDGSTYHKNTQRPRSYSPLNQNQNSNYLGGYSGDFETLPKAVDMTSNSIPDLMVKIKKPRHSTHSLRMLPGSRTSMEIAQFENAVTNADIDGIEEDDFVGILNFPGMILRFNSNSGFTYYQYSHYSRNFTAIPVGVPFDWTSWSDYFDQADWQKDFFIGDFNGDGNEDLIARAGTFSELIFNIGPLSTQSQSVEIGRVLGNSDNRFVGDFNGDGLDDILYRKLSTHFDLDPRNLTNNRPFEGAINHIHVSESPCGLLLSQLDENGNWSFRSTSIQSSPFDPARIPDSTSDDDSDNTPVDWGQLREDIEKQVRVLDVNHDGLDDLVKIYNKDDQTRIDVAITSFEDGNTDIANFVGKSRDLGVLISSSHPNITITDFVNDDNKKDFYLSRNIQLPLSSTVITPQFTSVSLKIDDVYRDIADDVNNAVADIESTKELHQNHIGKINELRYQHTNVMEKVATLSVKAEDIDSFEGQIYKWFNTHSIVSRDSKTGAPLTTKDSRQIRTSHLVDKDSRYVIASSHNSDLSDHEALYFGFETYEEFDQLVVNDGAIHDVVDDSFYLSGDSHTGKRAYQVRSNSLKLQPKNFNPHKLLSNADTAYVVSAYVKKATDAAVWVGADTLQYQYAPEQAKAKSTEDWQYVEGVVIGSDLTSGKTPSIHVFTSGGDVFIDDVMIRPLASVFSATVYNDLGLPIAEMNNNGLTKRMYYDSHNQLSTVIDDTGRIYGLNLSAFSRDNSTDGTFEQNAPNESTKFSFIDLGKINRLEASQKYHGAFDVDLGDQNRFDEEGRPNFDALYKDVLFSFSIVPEGDNYSFEFGLGSNISISNADMNTGVIQTYGGGSSFELKDAPVDFTIAVVDRKLMVWMNGKLSLQYGLSDASSYETFNWQLSNAHMAGDIITARNPVFKTNYTNGLGQQIQTVRPLFSTSGSMYGQVVKSMLYDGWGHLSVTTLPMASPDSHIQYRLDAITSFNWGSGEMEGEISDYYRSTQRIIDKKENDYKYPYFRTYYADYPISRIVKKNKAGQDFYGQTDNATNKEYQSSDGRVALLPGMEDENFNTTTTTSSLGTKNTEIKDQMGRKVLSRKGDATSQKIHGFSSQGFRADTLRAPNYFTQGSNGMDLFHSSVHQQEDILSLSDINISPDRGQVEIIKDQMAKVAFIKPASSTATEDQFGQIKYYRYDEQERVIEQGIYSARWDKERLSTLSKAPYWFDNDMYWTKLFVYDIDDDNNTMFSKGKTTKTIHKNGDYVVESDFVYNIYGQMVQNTLSLTDHNNVEQGVYVVTYEYYPTGQIKKITYPDGYEVIYRFNRQGKLALIGTAELPDLYASYEYDELDRLMFEGRNSNQLLSVNKYDLRGRNKKTDWTKNRTDTIFTQELEFFKDTQYYDTKISQIKYGGSAYSDIKYEFEYDQQDRLKKSIRKMDEGGQLESTSNTTYNFDTNSNITSYHDTSKEEGTVSFNYQHGTNQDYMDGHNPYNADGLRYQFESILWGEETYIAYNPYSNKAQIIYHSDGDSFYSISRAAWYKLAPVSHQSEVLAVQNLKTLETSEGDQIITELPKNLDSQMFRFEKSEYEGYESFNIKVRSNEELNVCYDRTSKKLYLGEPKTGDENGLDEFFLLPNYQGNIQISNAMDYYNAFLSIQENEGVHEVVGQVMSSHEALNSGAFIPLPIEMAKPSDEFMMYHYDAKNNKVMKTRKFVDKENVFKQDTLIYVHGNNRLPLAEFHTGISRDAEGNETLHNYVSNYIYGPEFGSIGMMLTDIAGTLNLESSEYSDGRGSHFITPDDDVYVRMGKYSQNNYGNLSKMVIKKGKTSAYVRKALLEFDLTKFPAMVNSNSLQLSLHVLTENLSDHPTNYKVSLMPGSDWNENQLTGDQMDDVQTTTLVTVSGAHEGENWIIDLSSQKDLIMAHSRVTFIIESTEAGPAYKEVASKEDPDSEKHPKLIIGE